MVKTHLYHIFHSSVEESGWSAYTASKSDGKERLYSDTLDELATRVYKECNEIPGLRTVDHFVAFNFTSPYEYAVSIRGALHKTTLLSDADKVKFLSIVEKIQTDNAKKFFSESKNRRK